MSASENISSSASNSQTKLDRFLVCGLGSLGQHCAIALQEFGASFSAIEQVRPLSWEFPDLPSLLQEELIIGDCRQSSLLKQSKICQCRAILIVTGNERVNIETAFAARLLNPNIRLVVRSSKHNLNRLLEEQLGNFIAFDANQLPASAFALAAAGGGTLGCFHLEGQLWQVLKHPVQPRENWCCDRLLHEINSRTRRVLSCTRSGELLPKEFYEWEPESRIQTGNNLIYIEVGSVLTSHQVRLKSSNQKRQFLPKFSYLTWKNIAEKFYQVGKLLIDSRTRQIASGYLCAVSILLIIGTVLFHLNYPAQTHWQDAFNVTLILLLGGFDNIFGSLNLPFEISWWLYLFSIGLTVTGTVLVGIFYAILTEKILASKFQLLRRRPPVPEEDHVVLIGLEEVGQRVAIWLQEFQQPVVGIAKAAVDPELLPKMSIVVGEIAQALTQVNLSKAKSVIVVTDDEMVNLEAGLTAHAANPSINLVLRTFGQQFSEYVARLFAYSHVICAYALVAEAFVGAAYGENILNLFRWNNQTILVTEYKIEDIDTLQGLLLAEVAYGYSVVPIFYQKYTRESPHLMPSDDTRLQVGDRLVVLATIEGLRRIEHGELASRRWEVCIKKATNDNAIFEGANIIARISGCSIGEARNLLNNLPGTVPQILYKHQALRLVRHLIKVQVMAHLSSI